MTDLAAGTFEMVREAFKGGDYSRALELVDQAIKEMPDDPALHEFRVDPVRSDAVRRGRGRALRRAFCPARL